VEVGNKEGEGKKILWMYVTYVYENRTVKLVEFALIWGQEENDNVWGSESN
jgi:hypothetical protein